MEIRSYSDFLDMEEQQYVINNTVNSSSWSFTGTSNVGESNNLMFWYLPLDNNKFFTEIFLKKIENTINQNFSLERVYANGQTYGLSGSLHYDQENGNNKYFTFLYYVQPTWHPEWGGHTVFYDNNNNMIYTQFPTPNLGIFFNSEILHAGLEPTRFCTLLRVTVAFKLKLK